MTDCVMLDIGGSFVKHCAAQGGVFTAPGLFAIKESVYKAWAPATGRWLDFTDAEVTIDPTAGRFRAALAVDGPWRLLDGRFAASAGLWLAVTVIAASALTDPIGPTAA